MYGEEFIFQDYLSDISICDKLIDYFQSSPQHEGLSAGGVNKELKNSTDVALEPGTLSKEYISLLQEKVEKYSDKFPFCTNSDRWEIVSTIQIQRYLPNEGYYAWHTERNVGYQPMCSRHLVFMTYLNDVIDGGGTEFYHQKLITKAKKGLTLIWPTDWTFMHRGEVSPTQTKYIITGWFNYIDTETK